MGHTGLATCQPRRASSPSPLCRSHPLVCVAEEDRIVQRQQFPSRWTISYEGAPSGLHVSQDRIALLLVARLAHTSRLRKRLLNATCVPGSGFRRESEPGRPYFLTDPGATNYGPSMWGWFTVSCSTPARDAPILFNRFASGRLMRFNSVPMRRQGLPLTPLGFLTKELISFILVINLDYKAKFI